MRTRTTINLFLMKDTACSAMSTKEIISWRGASIAMVDVTIDRR